MDQDTGSSAVGSPATSTTSKKASKPLSTEASEPSFRAALKYIHEVEALFNTRPENYQRFLANVKFWANGDFDAEEVRWRMGQLFGIGNSNLFEGFMLFKPEDEVQPAKAVVKANGKRTTKSKARSPKSLMPDSDGGRRPQPVLQEAVLVSLEIDKRLGDQRDKHVALRHALRLYAMGEQGHVMVSGDIEQILQGEDDLAERLLEQIGRSGDDA